MTITTTAGGYGHAAALAPAVTAVIDGMTPLDYLFALGATPEAVAGTLRGLGVTGRKGDPEACPVANYLRDYAGLDRPEVTDDVVIWGDTGTIRTPDPVRGFLPMFDAGGYPDLIAPAVSLVKATS